MSAVFERIEQCAELGSARDAASLVALTGRLKDPEWRVRFAAAVALGDRADEAALGPLVETLFAEDAAPLYTQQSDMGGAPAGAPRSGTLAFPAGTTDEVRAAWQRRGRIKQAVAIALGAIGRADSRALEILHRYVTDPKEDYAVRAAACKALGMIRSGESRPWLERAAQDSEWCTSTEARKALARVNSG